MVHTSGGMDRDLVPTGVASAQVNSPFDLALGEGLKAQAEASDRKTDNLPTISDVGKSLGGQLGGSDAKDAIRAVDKNTPGTISCLAALRLRSRFVLRGMATS